MRILLVTQYFWPENFRINDLVKSLVEKGEVVDVLTGKPNYPEGVIYKGYKAYGFEQENWNGVTVFRLPVIPRGIGSAWGLIANYLSFVITGTLLAPWILRKRQYDIIFVYAPSPILQAIPAILLKRLKNTPLVVWVQDLWPESLKATGYVKNPFILKAVEKVVKFIYSQTDLLLLQSKAFFSQVAALVANKRIHYYPNSVEAVFCNPPRVELPEVAPLNEGFTVIFAGNIGAAQGVEVIIEAAALLKDNLDIRFVVFGQGSRWSWMCNETNSRGLTNLHFPGRFPIETMPGLMSKASVLLVTLIDKPIFAATVPNKIQAYMAAGRPILACLNGEGAQLVLEAEAGLAVPAENAKALVEAVLQLYKMSQEERDQLGNNGRNYYKNNFDHDKLVDELISQLHEVSELHKGNE